MQPTTSQDAFNQLSTFQSSRRKPTDILKESQTRLGLPSAEQRKVGLRGAISNTENLLKGVDPSVTGRTAGTFTGEAQRNRLVQLERAPLADQFTEQSRALEGETANVADLNARALTEAQLALSSQDKQENDLRGIYDILIAREQAAEEKRRYEEQQRLAREQEAASRAAASAQSSYLSDLFGGGGQSGGGTPVAAGDPVREGAYLEVQNNVAKWGDADVRSDYAATLKSANYGNARDKLKIEMYKQARPDLFGPGAASQSRPLIPGARVLSNSNRNGLTILNSQPLATNSGLRLPAASASFPVSRSTTGSMSLINAMRR